MVISYKKLWKLLIDRDLKKKRPAGYCRHQPILRHEDGAQ